MTMTSIMTRSTSNNSLSVFPPCTADICGVAEEEKERVAVASITKPTCEMTEKCVQSCAAYGKVCPCAARIAAHAACDAMNELKKDSHIFPQDDNECNDNNNKPNFTYLNADDIVIGKKLGEGGFSNVNLCTIKTGIDTGKQFAVKYLKKRAMVDLHQFKHGAADLAVEAFFLQVLKHPHIVSLHGVTAGSVETNLASGKECGFFIVVDRLEETLEARLEHWRTEQEKNTTPRMAWMSSEYKAKKRTELIERIQIAIQIADAMHYLHSLGIVFRDLKPDNMGFDENGVLKIFDFGLAKELKKCFEHDNGKYDLTGNTGSRRYMAPEVARETLYNQSVDVYSFGILLWELCSCEKPFYGYSSNKHMQNVVLGGERPPMDSQHKAYWPMNLQWLMNHCWSSHAVLRPSFTVILEVLQDIVDGKETVPASLCNQSSLEKTNINPAVEVPVGGFAGLFPMSRKKRHETTGNINIAKSPDDDHHHNNNTKSPNSSSKANCNNTRSRSWGFVVKR